MLAKILSARIFASEAAIELARLGMRVGGGKAITVLEIWNVS